MLMSDISVETGGATMGEITIDLDAPFDAHQFYVQMRDWGLDPLVKDGGLYCGINLVIEERRVLSWAVKGDPEGSLRLGHARAAWERRTSDDEIIPLGVRQ